MAQACPSIFGQFEAGTTPDETMAEHMLRGRDYDQLSEEVYDALRQDGIRIEWQ